MDFVNSSPLIFWKTQIGKRVWDLRPSRDLLLLITNLFLTSIYGKSRVFRLDCKYIYLARGVDCCKFLRNPVTIRIRYITEHIGCASLPPEGEMERKPWLTITMHEANSARDCGKFLLLKHSNVTYCWKNLIDIRPLPVRLVLPTL